jgi:membrane fusion protein, multidrug efflux system
MKGRTATARMRAGGSAAGAGLLVLLIGLSGCSARGDAMDGGRPPVAVETVAAASADIVEGIDAVGALAPRFAAEIKSEAGGRIAEVFVLEWVRVTKGTPLARVDTRETEVLLKKAEAAVAMAQANLLEAEAAFGRAFRERERAENLREAGLMTRQGEDDARTAQDAAAARVAAARAQVRAAGEEVRHVRAKLAKAVVRAPFDGVVAERSVDPGEVVGEMQKVLFKIVDTRLLDLTVAVPSVHMGKVRAGQPLVFETDAVPGRTFAGEVTFINPVVSEADRSVRVVAEVPNVSGELKGGLFVKGRIETGRRAGVLQVPRRALVSWDVPAGTGLVFVADGDVARRREVVTGAVSGDAVEIVSGLAEGDRVITRGSFDVRDGDPVKAADGRAGGGGR